MNKNIIVLRDDNGKEFQVEVYLTYERDNNTYVAYTDNTKDSDGKERVYLGIYDKETEDAVKKFQDASGILLWETGGKVLFDFFAVFEEIKGHKEDDDHVDDFVE